MFTCYYEASKPNGIISGTVMFSTMDEAISFTENFEQVDGSQYSANRKTFIIGSPEEVV